MGEGGSIPFITMLGEKFPDTQFVITRRVGTEFKRPRTKMSSCTSRRGSAFTGVIAQVLANHFERKA